MPAARAQDVQDLVRQAPFIFRGIVRQVGAAAMPEARVTDQTAVVTVVEVLEAPPRLGDYTGKDITVELRQPVSDPREFVFFTSSWLYGSGLALREVGRLDASLAAGLRPRIAEAKATIADEKLQARIRAAELVVVGKVTAVAPLDASQGPLSEHDPMWRQATVSVESVEKGTPGGSVVAVQFPGSDDVMWYGSPRFAVGREGIWILDRDAADPFGLQGYTALDRLDCQGRDQLERIRTLIRALR